ncbi:hypothetical protein [Mycolicibacter senuensis]|uniref:hypothetical protein n=1 Tax=Mycolicibacter senuensis TaxID=386913 RepID=UPI000A23B4D6|nr:hypothetical protein [Mycolicibacter senuensis]ORW66876.1 hypothetical protein AWC24_13010 [Mycolicibacter senuensis]
MTITLLTMIAVIVRVTASPAAAAPQLPRSSSLARAITDGFHADHRVEIGERAAAPDQCRQGGDPGRRLGVVDEDVANILEEPGSTPVLAFNQG